MSRTGETDYGYREERAAENVALTKTYLDKRPPEQQQERAAESKQPAEAKKAERVPSTLAKSAQPKKDKEATKKGDGEGKSEQKSWFDFTLTDALIALFTAVPSSLACRRTTHGGTMIATKLAARAALRSAVSAKRTVETMEETAGRQLRAYVFATESNIDGFDTPNVPAVHLLIKNMIGPHRVVRLAC
jgi:hypothetical protein